MQCFSELVPPTAVTQALSLPFLSPLSTELVVAKTSVLQIFSISRIPDGPGDEGQPSIESNALRLIGEYPLSGTVTSLARVRAAGTQSGGDALIVSFSDAKVSLVEWDPENHRISTISIHYYEGNKVRLAPYEQSPREVGSKLLVDPQNRCAALRFAARDLAIIPIRQPEDEVVTADVDFLDDAEPQKNTNGAGPESTRKHTPYGPSFVLPLTALDPSLTHPVDLTFLYEYREPTLGIVSANRNASVALLEARKDPLTYTVISLDIEERASTTLLSVKGLPFDIWKIIPLAQPIGGTLLVGANVLIHVDQSGKTTAIGVNEFAHQTTNFSMTDQSQLNLRLENSCIETLNPDTGDLLIILSTGKLAILNFNVDGRTVSGIHVHPVEDSHGGAIPNPLPSIATIIGADKIFLGSQTGDAKLITWTGQGDSSSRKRNHAQMLGEDESDIPAANGDEDNTIEDDLYAEEGFTKSVMYRASKSVEPGNYAFREIGRLPNLGPIKSIAFARSESENSSDTSFSLLTSVGEGKSSKVVKIAKNVPFEPIREHQDSGVQSLHLFTVQAEGQAKQRYAVASRESDAGASFSTLLTLEGDLDATTEEKVLDRTVITGTEFDSKGKTLAMYSLKEGVGAIQVCESAVRFYTPGSCHCWLAAISSIDDIIGLFLSHVFPVASTESSQDLHIIHSSFCDTFVLLLLSDSSVQLLRIEESGSLIQVPGSWPTTSKWLSACLYQFKDGQSDPYVFLLDEVGGLTIGQVTSFGESMWYAPNLAAMSAVLTTDDRQRRAAARETLTEVLFANLGPVSDAAPYLVVRSSLDEITLYEPFHHPSSHNHSSASFCDNLRFRKVPGLHVPNWSADLNDVKPGPIKALQNVDNKSVIFVPGGSPGFIIKESITKPQIYACSGPSIMDMTVLGSNPQATELTYIDSTGTCREASLSRFTSFEISGCVVNSIYPLPVSHEICDIVYDSGRGLYIIISSEYMDYYTQDEEGQQYETEHPPTLRPQTKQYYINLFTPVNDTIISTYMIPSYEHVTGIACAPLEISEETHALEHLVTVGTILRCTNEYADKGAVYVFSIVDVVPEPEKPETAFKLHLLSREDARAPVTAIAGIAGLSGTAQGQKLMFRGMREDLQNLPVAFLDTPIYTTCLKSLGTSNMWLAADYWKGLWFGGYSFEPPKISVFGKSAPAEAIVDAEFLPQHNKLCLLGADDLSNLKVWQFDPENPKSDGGIKLMPRPSFHLGHLVTSMAMIRSSGNEAGSNITNGHTDDDAPTPFYQVITAATSGQIGLVTPLDETQFRRLSALHSQLVSSLEHPCGLNPRMYRMVDGEDAGGRGVIDGVLVARVGELGAGKRTEITHRVAGNGGWWEISSDMALLSGKGLKGL